MASRMAENWVRSCRANAVEKTIPIPKNKEDSRRAKTRNFAIMQFHAWEGPQKINLRLDVSGGEKSGKCLSVIGMNKTFGCVDEEENYKDEENWEIFHENLEEGFGAICNIGLVESGVLTMQKYDVNQNEQNCDDTKQKMEDCETANCSGGYCWGGQNTGDDFIAQKWNDTSEVQNDESCPVRHVAGNDHVTGKCDT